MSKQDKDTGKISEQVKSGKDSWIDKANSCLIWIACILVAMVLTYALVFYAKIVVTLLLELASISISDSTQNNSSGVVQNKTFDGARNIAFSLTALVGGPLLIWRTILADRQTKTAQMQMTIAQEKTKLDEQTHYTTLYTKSIELLGATRVVKKRDEKGKTFEKTEAAMELRLGAIYALERIARDSWKDHWPIMEVLTAYIRENSPYKEGDKLEPITTDIQAAITVIGRRNPEWIEDENDKGQILDISECNLTNADFKRLNYANSHFTKTLFKNVTFVECNFSNAIFKELRIYNSKFDNCDLRNTKLSSGKIIGTNFTLVNLQNSTFSSIKVEHTKFKKCDLGFFFFHTVGLTNIIMSACSLIGAKFINCGSIDIDISTSIVIGITLFSSDGYKPSNLAQSRISNCLIDDFVRNISSSDNYFIDQKILVNQHLKLYITMNKLKLFADNRTVDWEKILNDHL